MTSASESVLFLSCLIKESTCCYALFTGADVRNRKLERGSLNEKHRKMLVSANKIRIRKGESRWQCA